MPVIPRPSAPSVHETALSGLNGAADVYALSPYARLLARPEEGDPAVVSGESGAVTAGVLDALMRGDAPSEVRQALGLNESSRVLLVSTEGDTDQENYQRIINGED